MQQYDRILSCYRRQVEREFSTGKVKVRMCMQQYDRILSCYRRPGLEEDVQMVKERHNNGNEHILVMSRNQAFVVHTRTGGRLLSFADILFQLQEVIRMSEARKGLVIPLGASAAGDRATAARFWNILREGFIIL
ncbi:unnamed protein product [Strongylus vulgaris]|uniref:Choline/carnitine acyltransferase domain-containing protein n=1 Tax=Strongylus vulgaris TaxID=40348 RepID=A0A3P7JFV3_STRVU|nr:unnamed protein product [Strongylus vulgaris]